jgi:hypothetical protein
MIAALRRYWGVGFGGLLALLLLLVSLPAAAQDGLAGMIRVQDQTPVNGQIIIERAMITRDGWVVLHPAGPDGNIQLGANIGIAPIKAGTSIDIAITLSEAVEAGTIIWPMLHVDAGTPGVYEFPDGPDTPVVVSGMPVMQKITLSDGVAAVAVAPAPDSMPATSGEGGVLGLLLGIAILALGGGTVLRRAGGGEVWLEEGSGGPGPSPSSVAA